MPVFRSTGCRECRRRKVKCDETWPVCNHCAKTNRLCPGPYEVDLFIDESPRMKLQHESGKIQVSRKAQPAEAAQGIGTVKQNASVHRQVLSAQTRPYPLDEPTDDVQQSNKAFSEHSSTGNSLVAINADSSPQVHPGVPFCIRSPKLEHIQLMYQFAEAVSYPVPLKRISTIAGGGPVFVKLCLVPCVPWGSTKEHYSQRLCPRAIPVRVVPVIPDTC